MPFDDNLNVKVREEYPSLIYERYRLLNTPEYIEKNGSRIQKIVEATEITIHFLALIALNNLIDEVLGNKIVVSDNFRIMFKDCFNKPSMGKWGALLRETIRFFKTENIKMFIEELPDYFIKGESHVTEAQKAFNEITKLRNEFIGHPEKLFTESETIDVCINAENCLQTILKEMEFISRYQILNISKITVDFHRWSSPIYNMVIEDIKLAEIASNYQYERDKLILSPSLIITKKNKHEYLNLEPLFLYSNEGERKIKDLFMFLEWGDNKQINYVPMNNGGRLNLFNTKIIDVIGKQLLKFFEMLSTKEDYGKFEKLITKK